MSSRRPPRAPRGPTRPSTSGGDDSSAQTDLGLLLQRALAAQQTAEAPEQEKPAEPVETEAGQGTQFCADCWNALTFKDADGRQLARCAKDLWVKPAYT
ncbi:MAG: hypothetical protein ACRDI2_22835, partial [Chloroflexota bacterium]